MNTVAGFFQDIGNLISTIGFADIVDILILGREAGEHGIEVLSFLSVIAGLDCSVNGIERCILIVELVNKVDRYGVFAAAGVT